MLENKGFDFNTVKDFDNHISLSIPNYDQLFSIFNNLVNIFSEPNTSVIDYGCSSGKLLNETQLKGDCSYFGIDISNLLPENTNHKSIHFVKQDAIEFGTGFTGSVSVVVCMFFLQFLGRKKRKDMLEIMERHLKEGATLLIAEKIILNDAYINNLLFNLHMTEKRKYFNDQEILDKNYQLLNSMYCKEEIVLLNELNFGTVTKVWQSYNFCGYVVR